MQATKLSVCTLQRKSMSALLCPSESCGEYRHGAGREDDSSQAAWLSDRPVLRRFLCRGCPVWIVLAVHRAAGLREYRRHAQNSRFSDYWMIFSVMRSMLLGPSGATWWPRPLNLEFRPQPSPQRWPIMMVIAAPICRLICCRPAGLFLSTHL